MRAPALIAATLLASCARAAAPAWEDDEARRDDLPATPAPDAGPGEFPGPAPDAAPENKGSEDAALDRSSAEPDADAPPPDASRPPPACGLPLGGEGSCVGLGAATRCSCGGFAYSCAGGPAAPIRPGGGPVPGCVRVGELACCPALECTRIAGPYLALCPGRPLVVACAPGLEPPAGCLPAYGGGSVFCCAP